VRREWLAAVSLMSNGFFFAVRHSRCAWNGKSLPIVEDRTLRCVAASFDVNVTPDKRKILIHNEKAFVDSLQQVTFDARYIE
jgi:DNA mismatch repair protein, C-terminal domain